MSILGCLVVLGFLFAGYMAGRLGVDWQDR